MKKSLLLLCLLAVLLLNACSPAIKATPPVETQSSQATPTAAAAGAYPPAPESAYPAAPSGTSPIDNASFSAYPPAESDADMERGNFTVDSVTLQPNPDNDKFVDIHVKGSLPTSCNIPRVNVTPPGQDNKINIEIYSVKSKDQVCAESIMPFDRVVASIGGYPAGKYTIVVNGKSVGDITLQ